MRGLILAVSCWLALLQTAQAAIFGDDEARKKIADVQQQVQTQNQTLQSIDKRVAALEAAIKGQGMLDLLSQIDQLKQELRTVKGQQEVTAHDVESTQQRQNDLYIDVDGRLRKIESGAVAATPNPPTDVPNNTTAAASVAADTPSEAKDFEVAQTLLKTGKYKEAFEAFDKFLHTYTTSARVPEAQYSLGFAQFSLKNYKAAISTQQKVLKQFPDSAKAPDAAFNIANAQIQLADIESAKKTLRDLLAKYPNSEVTPSAKRRLAVLESIKTP